MVSNQRGEDMDENRIGDFYFERSNGERILLAENVDRKAANVVMKQFLDDHNFQSYYTRVWEEGNELWMDFGSHTQFMVLVYKENNACGSQEKT